MHSTIKILLAEDSPEDARFFQEILKDTELNCNVAQVEDGAEMMSYLRNQGKYADASCPDVIVLDLNMPRMNGHEVLLQMRRDPLLERIPVILLTVSQKRADVETAMHLKMNYYLCKPVETVALKAALLTIAALWMPANSTAE